MSSVNTSTKSGIACGAAMHEIGRKKLWKLSQRVEIHLALKDNI